MSLLDTIISHLPESNPAVETVIVGARAVLVASSRCGIAEVQTGPQAATDPGLSRFFGRPLEDLFHMASSSNPLEAALGVAAVNAVLAGSAEKLRFQPYGIPRARGKTVGLVGAFAFASQLKDLANDVIQVEPEDAEHILHQVDIAVLPGSAIVDHSLESLLAASASCYTIIFGPSTPLSPVLFAYGADQLVGVKVVNREEVAKWITAGTDNLMACSGLKSVVMRRQDKD